MLEIMRQYGGLKTRYIYSLISDNKALVCHCGGKSDLFWVLIGEENSLTDSFIINKEENRKVYEVFDEMYGMILRSDNDDYKDIPRGKIHDVDRVLGNYHDYDIYNFVDKEKEVVTYISDEEHDGVENEVKIHKEEDRYRLEFIYKNENGYKNGIRFGHHDCRYGQFIIPFHQAYEDFGEVCKYFSRIKLEEYSRNEKEKAI